MNGKLQKELFLLINKLIFPKYKNARPSKKGEQIVCDRKKGSLEIEYEKMKQVIRVFEISIKKKNFMSSKYLQETYEYLQDFSPHYRHERVNREGSNILP